MQYTTEQINQIAENIERGKICYFNPETTEIETISNKKESIEDELYLDVQRRVSKWKSMIRIDPLRSFESFEIMEDFIRERIPEGILNNRLCSALSSRNPYQNFEEIIKSSHYNFEWSMFKSNKIKDRIIELLKIENYQVNY